MTAGLELWPGRPGEGRTRLYLGVLARSQELAKRLNDRTQLGAVPETSASSARPSRAGKRPHISRTTCLWAVASVEESPAIKPEIKNQVGAASSYGQLGILRRRPGNLDLAEDNPQ